MTQIDTIFAGKLDHVEDFKFDAKVTAVFSNMIRRSVPGYELVTAMTAVFAAGSFSLELPLLDGRILRSAPAPELFVCGECPDFRFAAERARRVSPGERVKLRLQFSSMR